MFSTLDNITIYTTDEPVALKDVLAEMKKQEGKNPPADPNGKEDEIKKYFASIIPTYDTVKVYLSDMKKLIKWYNLLNGKGLIDELLKDETAVATEEKAEGGAEEKPKKATKKAADKDGEKSAKPKAEKASTKAKVAAPRTNAPPKKITTPRKAS
jgi:pyruvate/2-oxoglutarate dehydrogenase complex dihydrolipoamide acyltransferase (E2) component